MGSVVVHPWNETFRALEKVKFFSAESICLEK